MGTKIAAALATSASRPGIHIPENFAAVIATGLDDVMKRSMDRPREGMQFFRKKPMKKATNRFQSHYGLGTVSQNRDSEALPYDETGLGFKWDLTVNTFRGAIKIEKELVEDELYGTISDMQAELVESEALSRELVLADVFDRALGASGAPFLCEDGMYLIDSARPNAFKRAGTWSNLEAPGAITPTSIFNTQLNFGAQLDERGQKAPMKMSGMVIRRDEEKTVWEIVQSDKRPNDAQNARNFQYGRFEYTVYNMLSTATAFYVAADGGFQSAKNELYFGDRVAPQLETWDTDGGDVHHQRIRTRFGVGCGRPQMWRGQTVS